MKKKTFKEQFLIKRVEQREGEKLELEKLEMLEPLHR